MHNQDDKYPTRSGFKPGTSRLQAPVDTKEPSGPAEYKTTEKNQKKDLNDHAWLFLTPFRVL